LDSGIQDPEFIQQGVPEDWVRFGPTFACCPEARAHLVLGWLVIFGTGSFLAMVFDLVNPIDGWMRIFCICSYVLALILGFVGLLSILIGGIGGCGRIRLWGRRLRDSGVGLAFLGVFAAPWLTLFALYWRPK